MNPIRYVMVGGFLGAGKTTTIGKLAKHYTSQGFKVGIVTNDQAVGLVDTNSLRAQGYEVGEVAGACFCCRFNDLVETISELGQAGRPDLILAEPVGSCTDLVATVLQPIQRLYSTEFQIAPYVVILKPSHGLRVLQGKTGAGFSPKAEYILRKQLEEADGIVINRIDELSQAEIDELSTLLALAAPGVPILRTSALTGQGIDSLVEFLAQKGNFGRKVLDIDYDTYAEGEAELGWLNSSIQIQAESTFELDKFLWEIVSRLKSELSLVGAETAHLKCIGLWEGFYGVANLVASSKDPELSLASNCKPREFDLIVNARVACDPELLEDCVKKVVELVALEFAARAEFRQTQSFRPGRPMPTHRFTDILPIVN